MTTSFENIPRDVLIDIYRTLPLSSLSSMSQTSRRHRDIAYNNYIKPKGKLYLSRVQGPIRYNLRNIKVVIDTDDTHYLHYLNDKDIRNITFTDKDISLEIFEVIRTNPDINVFNFSDTEITDDMFIHIMQFYKDKDVVKINLLGSSIIDISLEFMMNFTTLQSINLSFTNISDEGIAYLTTTNRNIKKIKLNSCDITDKALRYLGDSNRNLERISIKENDLIGDDGIISLVRNNHNLRKIKLSYTDITDKALYAIADTNSNINVIDLGNTEVTNETFIYFLKRNQHITTCYIQNTHILWSGLNFLINNNKAIIKKLRVTDHFIDNDDIKRLRGINPDINIRIDKYQGYDYD